MENDSAGKRRKRFKACPDTVDNMRLTARDVEILRQVFKHRFLRSTHILDLIGGSQDNLLRRLQALFHHGYLARPVRQTERHSRPFNEPYIYALGKRGIDVLAEEFSLKRAKLNWAEKNATGRGHILHTLMVADIMVALELACRRHGSIRLISGQEILEQASPASRRQRNPFSWKVDLKGSDGGVRAHTIIPDKIFGLEFLNLPSPKNKFWYFLEADRATEPDVRTRFDRHQTAVYRKMVEYETSDRKWRREEENRKQGIRVPITRPFHFHMFRVLIVTTSLRRMHNLAQLACKEFREGKGSPNFLFTSLESLKTAEDIFSLIWCSGNAKTMRLLEGIIVDPDPSLSTLPV